MERDPNERSNRIMRLVELIEHINKTIDVHKDESNPDRFVIEQYMERRAEYLNELALLLQPLGVALQWQPQQAA